MPDMEGGGAVGCQRVDEFKEEQERRRRRRGETQRELALEVVY